MAKTCTHASATRPQNKKLKIQWKRINGELVKKQFNDDYISRVLFIDCQHKTIYWMNDEYKRWISFDDRLVDNCRVDRLKVFFSSFYFHFKEKAEHEQSMWNDEWTNKWIQLEMKQNNGIIDWFKLKFNWIKNSFHVQSKRMKRRESKNDFINESNARVNISNWRRQK